MISILARSLVISGALILIWALFSIRNLTAKLPQGALRQRSYVMVALIVLFLVSYVVYAAIFWHAHIEPAALVVPVVFFFGACFVWLTATLALKTAFDVIRVSFLEQQASTDPLTGLYNRRYLDRCLQEEVARARRYGQALSVLMLDVDHFKQVNDLFGHPAGDEVLLKLAKVAAEELRETDILARYGGEEFLVVVPHTSLSDATELAERLRQRIESHNFSLSGDASKPGDHRITASIGVASLGEGLDTVEKLIQTVDGKLYRAKRDGRNRVVADAAGHAKSTGT